MNLSEQDYITLLIFLRHLSFFKSMDFAPPFISLPRMLLVNNICQETCNQNIFKFFSYSMGSDWSEYILLKNI